MILPVVDELLSLQKKANLEKTDHSCLAANLPDRVFHVAADFGNEKLFEV
jgi:hypothetical protein